MREVLNYPWPGNIRELKNLVHRLLIQGGSEEIQLEEIELQITTRTAARRLWPAFHRASSAALPDHSTASTSFSPRAARGRAKRPTPA
jgi:transcriptional regulator with AAA-type ATPase domain